MTKAIKEPIKYIPEIIIHQNGPARKRKVMAHTDQGIVSARRAYYSLYHKDWNFKGKIIHLNQDDLDFRKDNLILLTTREANTLVHFNNQNIVLNNPELQSKVIQSIRASIALDNLTNELKGGDNDE